MMVKIYLAGERFAAPTTAKINKRAGEHAATLWTTRVKRRLFSGYRHADFTTNSLSAAVQDAKARGWDCFLDSGAFSFAQDKKKAPPSLDEYARFVRKHADTFAIIAPLDVIGATNESARATFHNYTRLRHDLDAPVQPVFHVFEPDVWLHRNIEEVQRINGTLLLGGMVNRRVPRDRLVARLDQLFANYFTDADGRPRFPVHGFGIGDEKILRRFPFASADSGSWLATGILGACRFRVVTVGGNTEFRTVYFSAEAMARDRRPHFDTLPTEARDVVAGWLSEFGVSTEQVTANYIWRDIVNAAVAQGREDLGATRFDRDSGR